MLRKVSAVFITVLLVLLPCLAIRGGDAQASSTNPFKMGLAGYMAPTFARAVPTSRAPFTDTEIVDAPPLAAPQMQVTFQLTFQMTKEYLQQHLKDWYFAVVYFQLPYSGQGRIIGMLPLCTTAARSQERTYAEQSCTVNFPASASIPVSRTAGSTHVIFYRYFAFQQGRPRNVLISRVGEALDDRSKFTIYQRLVYSGVSTAGAGLIFD